MKRILLTAFTIFNLIFLANAQVVITEIMYNPPEIGTDSLEFIELHNSDTNGPVDISGYWFSDGFDFTFPAGVTIPAGGYVIVATDSVAFQNNFGIMAYQWDANDALANGGEEIGLRSSTNMLVDTVAYDDDGVIWPIEADAMGYSLVLCDPTSDNMDPANWSVSGHNAGFSIEAIDVFAHPGSACTAVGVKDEEWITTFVYPNPSNGTFFIENNDPEIHSTQVFNLSGELVHSQTLNGTRTQVEITLSTGLYFIQIGTGMSKLMIK